MRRSLGAFAPAYASEAKIEVERIMVISALELEVDSAKRI